MHCPHYGRSSVGLVQVPLAPVNPDRAIGNFTLSALVWRSSPGKRWLILPIIICLSQRLRNATRFSNFQLLKNLPRPPARFSNFNLKIFATSPGKTISSLKKIIEMFARLSTSFFLEELGGGGCGLLLGLGLGLGFRFCVRARVRVKVRVRVRV